MGAGGRGSGPQLDPATESLKRGSNIFLMPVPSWQDTFLGGMPFWFKLKLQTLPFWEVKRE